MSKIYIKQLRPRKYSQLKMVLQLHCRSDQYIQILIDSKITEIDFKKKIPQLQHVTNPPHRDNNNRIISSCRFPLLGMTQKHLKNLFKQIFHATLKIYDAKLQLFIKQHLHQRDSLHTYMQRMFDTKKQSKIRPLTEGFEQRMFFLFHFGICLQWLSLQGKQQQNYLS